MSGQKYRRTNFDDDENTSTGGTPPGITYDPAVAFKAGATFWQKRTALEKAMLVLLTLFLVTIIVMCALLTAKYEGKVKQTTSAELCTTRACVTVASSILNSMDTSVDPCEDFYQYACGGWIRSHPIPSGQARWGTFGVMWKENQLVMKNVLERPANSSTSAAEKKAKLYYNSCMDPNKVIESVGDKPLIEIMRSLGGWNISSRAGKWDVQAWDLQHMTERVHSLGFSAFVSVWVAEDEKMPNKNIFQFDQGGLGLARDYYLNKTIKEDEVLSAYLEYMTTIGELLGGERNDTEAQMMEVIEFEQELAAITTPDENRRDEEKQYHKMTIKDLQQSLPILDLASYLNNVMTRVKSKTRVGPDDNVIVYAPDFMTNLTGLVTAKLKTPEGKNTLNNYLMWHVVKVLSSHLSKPFVDAGKEFSKVLTGVTGEEEQWRLCTGATNGVLGFALGAMFVKEVFHGASKDEAEAMIVQIKEAFKANLPNLDWMDEATRLAAIDKANAVVDMIGFPPYIVNATALDERYQELEINETDYFGNNIRSLLYGMKRNFDKLRKAPDKKSWSMTPPTVNAYYSPTKNEIVFPAGILQAPFFDQEYPKSLNFGAMGVVMGHELTHGFDDQGREYNKDGLLKQWWNDDSVARFTERTKCMADQYSKYKLHGQNVKGKQTLGENIADNGGLKSAFHAYENWVDRYGEEKLLPGVSLTHKQLFYVSFAQVWCSNSKEQTDKILIATDPHSPSQFRVIGPLSNSREFSEQFQCKEGSRMNPSKKCEIW